MRGYNISEDTTVIQMASLKLSGNVIPVEWFSALTKQNGKPYTDAIILLSDIVYWYRPIEIRDEKTGKFVGYRKKFKADKLQRNYASFAEQYGYSKDQIRFALYYLRDKGLIDLDFRSIVADNINLSNVLFIGLNVEKLIEINTPSPKILDTLSENFGTPSPKILGDPLLKNSDTYTETTTETTTEITTEVVGDDNDFSQSAGIDIDELDSKIDDVYRQVTGLITWPGTATSDNRKIIEAALIKNGMSTEAAVADLKPYYETYTNTKSKKTGRQYSRTGMGWLDWYMNGEIPSGPKPKQSDNGGFYV